MTDRVQIGRDLRPARKSPARDIVFSSFSTVSSRKILTGRGNSWTLVAGDIGDNETQTASNELFSFSFLQIILVLIGLWQGSLQPQFSMFSPSSDGHYFPEMVRCDLSRRPASPLATEPMTNKSFNSCWHWIEAESRLFNSAILWWICMTAFISWWQYRSVRWGANTENAASLGNSSIDKLLIWVNLIFRRNGGGGEYAEK